MENPASTSTSWDAKPAPNPSRGRPRPKPMTISDFIALSLEDKMSSAPQDAPRGKSKRKFRNKTEPPSCRTTQIQDLNDDCLINVFSFLPIVDLVRIQRVCRRWNSLSLQCWKTKRQLNLLEDFWGVGKIKVIIDRYVLKKILKLCGRFLTHIDVSEERALGKIPYVRIVSCKSILQLIVDMCPNIQSINIGRPNSHAVIEIVTHNFNKLTDLTLQIPNFDYFDSQLSELFLKRKNLRYLKLEESKISAYTFEDLNFNNLNELHMIRCEFEDPDSVQEAIAKLSKLHSLSVDRCFCRISRIDKVMSTAGAVKTLRKLKLKTYLSSCVLQDTNFLSDLPNLVELTLYGIDMVNDEVLARVASKCKNLKTLDIAESGYVTNISISYMAELRHLEYINLRSLSNITCENLDELSQIKGIECTSCQEIKNEGFLNLMATSTNIRLIKLQDCAGITKELIENVRLIESETIYLELDNSKISYTLYRDIHSLTKTKDQIVKKYEMFCIACYKNPIDNCLDCCNKVEEF